MAEVKNGTAGKYAALRAHVAPVQGLLKCGERYTIGRKTDGTVCMAGMMDRKWDSAPDWTDVAALCAGEAHMVGLKKDGTVVATGGKYEFDDEDYSEDYADDVDDYYVEPDDDEDDYADYDNTRDVSGWRLLKSGDTLEKALTPARQAAAEASRIAALEAEKKALNAELAELRGLFTGKRRRAIEARIAELEGEMLI